MCGITGAIWWDRRRSLDEVTLQRMVASLEHRGPDAAGTYRHDGSGGPASPGVALGHRRLAVIDLVGGHQPMGNQEGTVHVVLNGEIYNYRTLREELDREGYPFRTESDTEVILALYERIGTACFERLNGMFAVAIWDRPRGRLVLARDRMGQKPLYYAHGGGAVLFGSELKSLLASGKIDRCWDPGAVDQFLTLQYVPAPLTVLRGVKKVRPGTHLVFHNDQVDETDYWKVPRPGEVEEVNDRSAACRQVAELLSDAVRLRLQSDVPLGAFLSGGVDSSLLVALMQQASTRPIPTFSIGFDEQEYDERHHARQVARHIGTEHHDMVVEPSAIEMLPQLAWHYDEPFGDSSAIPTWYLSRFAREHVTVALTGDGGDELFGGYDRYRAVGWGGRFDRLPERLRSFLFSPAWQHLPASSRRGSFGNLWKRFAAAMAKSPATRYLDWVSIFHADQRHRLYRPEFAGQLDRRDDRSVVCQAWHRAATDDPVAAAAYADLVSYLPGDLLVKVDIASMAHGLECRQPFLDHRLVEYLIRCPTHWKTGWWRGKRLLRDTFGGLLPASIWRRPKQGFGIPIHQWFRTTLRETVFDTLLSPNAAITEFCDPSALRKLVTSHDGGHRNVGYHLWCLLVLENWMERWGADIDVSK